MNESQVLKFNTTDTKLNISGEELANDDDDVCSAYFWSVVAIAQGRRTQAAQYTENVFIPSGIGPCLSFL